MAISLQELLVSMGLDTSAYDAGIGNATRKAEAFAATLAKAGGEINLKDFKSGLEQGLADGFREMEAQANTATAATSLFEKQLLRSETAGASFSAGMRTIRSSTLGMATSMLEVPGPIGRLVSGMLLLGAGSLVVTGIAAGAALIGFAYSRLTEDSRKAREELDKQTDALLKQREAQRPLETAQTGFAKQAADLKNLTEQFNLAAQAAQKAQALPGSSGVFAAAVALGHMADLTDQIVKREQAMVQATTNVGDAAVAAFAGIISAGQGTPAVFEKLNAEIVRLQADLKAATSAGDLDRMGKDVRDLETAFGALDAAAGKKITDLLTRFAAAPAEGLALLLAAQTRLNAEVAAQGGPLTANLATLENQQKVTEALVAEADRVTKAINERTDPLKLHITLMEQQGKIAQQLADIFFKPPAQTGTLPGVPDASAQVAEIKRVSDALEAAQGLVRADKFLHLDTTEDQRQVAALTAAFNETVAAELLLLPSLNAEQQLAVLQALEDAGHRFGIELGLAAEKAKALRDTLRDIRAVTGAIRDIADAFGGLTASADKALRGIEGVAQGIASFATNPIAGIAGIIGGAVGVLSGIFGGESAALIAAENANTQALHDSTDALKKFAPGGASNDLAQFGKIIADAIAAGNAGGVARGFPGGFAPSDAFQTFLSELSAAGLTLADAEQIASQFGITLVQDGTLVSNAFVSLNGKLADAIRSVTEFGDSLDGQRRQLDLQAKLFGATGDLTPLGIDKQLLSQALGGSVAQALAGIDVNTAAGQVALKKFLQDLFTKIAEGFFTGNPDQLKTTADQLAQIMGTTADDLLNLGNAANGAIAGLTNVPTGFKLALATFNATLDTTADKLAKSIGGPFIETGPLTGGPRGGNLFANVRTGPAPGATNQFTLMAGAITVVQQPGENQDVFAERVVAALMKKSRSQSGDTLQFGNLV